MDLAATDEKKYVFNGRRLRDGSIGAREERRGEGKISLSEGATTARDLTFALAIRSTVISRFFLRRDAMTCMMS